MPTPTPESHSVQGRFSSNNPHHPSQEASQSSSIVGDNHRGHPSPSDTANNHAFPNPDSATSSDTQGIPASENVGGATSQYGSFHPDHDKVDLSQHEAWQNQGHHEFPTPQASSGASSTVSNPLANDGTGDQISGNVQNGIFVSSDDRVPDLSQHEAWQNQTQPAFPNPHANSGNSSATASNPLANEGNSGSGVPSQGYYGSGNTDSFGTGRSVQSGTPMGGKPEYSYLGEDTTSQASPIVENHHTNTDSAAPPASSGAVYNGQVPASDGTPLASDGEETVTTQSSFGNSAAGNTADSRLATPSQPEGTQDGFTYETIEKPIYETTVTPVYETVEVPTYETVSYEPGGPNADYTGVTYVNEVSKYNFDYRIAAWTPFTNEPSKSPQSPFTQRVSNSGAGITSSSPSGGSNPNPGNAPEVNQIGICKPTTSTPFADPNDEVVYSDSASDDLAHALYIAAENLVSSYGDLHISPKQKTRKGEKSGKVYTRTGTRGNAQDESWSYFEGRYADIASYRLHQLQINAHNTAQKLLYSMALVNFLKKCAHIQKENYKKAKDWENRGWGERTLDFIQFKEGPTQTPLPLVPLLDDYDIYKPNPAPSFDQEATSTDVSSAAPDNLDMYAIRCNEDNITHENNYTAIQSALATFEANCKYGTLDISPVLNDLYTLNNQSNQMMTWLTHVAQAFRDADNGAGNLVVYASTAQMDIIMQKYGIPILQPIDWTHPSRVYDYVPTSGFANDPVNVATGNFIEPETDLIFTGTASATTLSLTRMYNSLAVIHTQETSSGVFGLGWFSILDTRLTFNEEQASWFNLGGRSISFARAGERFARTAREPWWLTKVPATDELFTRVRDAQVQAYEQATVTGGSAVVPEVPFVWMVHNNQHEAYFYAPSGAPVALRQGHLSSLTVFVLAEDGTVTDLVHPVAHRGIHVNYEPAEETGGVRPAAAFMYNTIGERAGEPVQNVAYSYTEAAESSASVQVSGLLTEVTTGIGTRTYTHTERGLIHRVINSRGDLEVTNTYDDSGRVIAQISEYGRDISYTYTPSLTTIIADADTGENENLWVSDSKGRLVSITAADGTHMSMSYDRFSNRISITERDGSRLVRTSDARGHIKRERTPEGADYTYTWDEQDRLLSVSVRDARDVKNLSDPMPVNSYHYEESTLVVNPNPVAVLDGAGEATTFEYSPEGDVLKITDPTGVFMAFEYDEHHDIVAMLNPAGEAIRFTRDAAGQITSVSNPLGATMRLTYNAAGALTSMTNPLGARWTLTYPQQPVGDGAPYMVRAQRQGAQSRDTSVGALPEAVTDPAGNTTAFTYTAGGDIATVTNSVGGTTRHEYDTFGNLVKMITAGNRVWEYSWDGLSQLVGLTDPTGAITRFEYDSAGKLSQVTDPTGFSSTRAINRHEGAELIIGTQNGTFSSSFITTDVLGRVTARRRNVCGSPITKFEKHGKKHSSVTMDSEISTSTSHSAGTPSQGVTSTESTVPRLQHTGAQMYAYDAAGNVVGSLDANGGLTQYVRDAAGRVTRIISAAGRFTNYTYDTCGRLVTESVGLNEPVRVTDPVTGASSWEEPTRWAVTTLVYDAASQVIERHTPDGLVEKMTYDAAGRLIKVQAGRRIATYAWDACNQLVRVQDSTFGTRRYSYNELGQLVRVTDGLGNRTFFAYDADGLLTSVTDPTGAITEYEYDAAGRILEVAKKPHPDSAVTAPAIRTTYTWDAAGRLLSEDDGVRTRSFEYDARTGDLTRTLIDGSLAAEYGTGTPALPGSTITWMKDHTGDAPVTYWRVLDATGNLIEYTRQIDGTENISEPGTVAALDTFTSTGSYTLTYAYDADGFRTMMLTPYGSSQWVLDGAGRPIRSINTASIADPGVRERESVIGEFSYDVMGHLVRAQIGETISTWDFDQDGFVSSYEHTSEQGDENTAESVQVIRDHTGRIIGLDSTTTGLVMYSYDEAGQLTGARADGYELTWVYEDGLMVAERLYHHDTTEDETTQGRVLLGERQFIYNGLNQLLHCTTIERPYTVGEGVSAAWVSTEVSYTYNAAGQRTGQKSITSDGVIQERTYTWGITGALTTVSNTATDVHGAEVPGLCSRLRLHADATGVATAITGNDQVTVPLLWDPTSSAPHLLGAGSIPAAGADGGFSQAAVPGGFDPWSIPGVPNTGNMVGFGALSAPGLGTISATGAVASQVPGLPSALDAPGISGASALLTSVGLPEGVSFTGSGTLAVGGLALMGARVFDPSSKKFLSQDPLPPIVGAGWFADSYSFLGHDPVGMIDPWGTRPLSSKEYVQYTREQNLTFWKTTTIVVGTILMVAAIPFTGGTSLALAVAGGGLIGGGSAMKLDENGGSGILSIDWGTTAKGAATGALSTFATAGLGNLFTAGAAAEGAAATGIARYTTVSNQYVASAANGALSNSVGNTINYYATAENPNLKDGAIVAGTSAITGSLANVGGTALQQTAGKYIPGFTSNPTTKTQRAWNATVDETAARIPATVGGAADQVIYDTVNNPQNQGMTPQQAANSAWTGAKNKVIGDWSNPAAAMVDNPIYSGLRGYYTHGHAAGGGHSDAPTHTGTPDYETSPSTEASSSHSSLGSHPQSNDSVQSQQDHETKPGFSSRQHHAPNESWEQQVAQDNKTWQQDAQHQNTASQKEATRQNNAWEQQVAQDNKTWQQDAQHQNTASQKEATRQNNAWEQQDNTQVNYAGDQGYKNGAQDQQLADHESYSHDDVRRTDPHRFEDRKTDDPHSRNHSANYTPKHRADGPAKGPATSHRAPGDYNTDLNK